MDATSIMGQEHASQHLCTNAVDGTTNDIFGTERIYIKLWMSDAMSDVRKCLEYRLNGSPFGEIRNFSKFHEMSDRLTGFQIKNFGSPIRLS